MLTTVKSVVSHASTYACTMLCIGIASCQSQAPTGQSPTTAHAPVADMQPVAAGARFVHSAISTRTYSIGDLMFVPADYSNEPAATQPSGAQVQETWPVRASKAPRIADIAQYIIDNVDLDSWQTNGGFGFINPDPTTLQLQITQTEAVHQEIEAFLRDWRQQRSTQISLETRYIALDCDW